MRDTLIVIALTLVAIAIGAGLYFYGWGSLITVPPIFSSSTSQNSVQGTDVPFTVLATGSNAAVQERKNYLISSTPELRELWKLLNAPGDPPAVDFTQSSVLAIFAGQEPTAGYSIAVSKVADAASRLVVISLTRPGGSCILAQMVTTPYEVISLPKTTLPLTHEELTTTASCLE